MPLRYSSNQADNSVARCAAPRILLVEPDEKLARELQRDLALRFPTIASAVCGNLASARAYLSGNGADVVLTADELPDGSGLELLDLRLALGLTSYIFVRTRKNGEASRAAMRAGATACFTLTPKRESLSAVAFEMSRVLGIPDVGTEPAEESTLPPISLEEAVALLEELRAETGSVAHAINNPLTVITGNAQLVLEVARMEGRDSAVLGPIEDINAAAGQLSDALTRLSALRQRIAKVLGSSDGIAED